MGTCNCHDGSDKTVEKLGTAVVVHIYDLGRDAVTHFSNSLLHAVGLGVYHVGVEVYGAEWSYCLDGVYSCPPSSDPLYKYRECLMMGHIPTGPEEVERILRDLVLSWQGEAYDALHNNCLHFADTLCCRLGVGHLPTWTVRFTGHSKREISL
mmetsp:Transcript_107249/g.301788  ORF Transcript_107249/g.301788 Transcript_107249/m.301788 type:complete len:153 (-) Transcript_107249:103-561(-)